MVTQLIRILKNSQFPAWILSFYVFIWFLQIGNRIDFLGSIRVEFIIGSLLIVLSLLSWANHPNDSKFFHSSFVKSVYFLYLFFIIYTVFSYSPEESRSIFIDRILKFSMFTLFIGTLVRNRYDLALFLIGFCAAIIKIIQEGVFGIITGGMIWENQGIPRLHGVTLLYRHPNSLAGLSVSALPFFLFLYRFQTKLLKLFFICCIAGLLAIILYSGSRTGYVATIVLLIAVLMRTGLFKFKNILVFIFLAPLIFFTIPQDYKDRFSTMFKSEEERGSSANKRIEILKDAAVIAAKYPLGIGVHAFPKVREMEFGRHQDTHNLYLEILTNIGPFGFLAFAIFIALLFKTNLRSRATHLKKGNHFFAEVCYIVNLYILCRLTLGMFGMDLYEVYWWFAAGLTIALAKLAVKEEFHSKKKGSLYNNAVEQ